MVLDALSSLTTTEAIENLVEEGRIPAAGYVPPSLQFSSVKKNLIMVTCRLQANNDLATALVDSGAGIIHRPRICGPTGFERDHHLPSRDEDGR